MARKRIDRREFLGISTIAAGGAIAATAVVAGFGGFYAGTLSVPPKEIPKEILVPREIPKPPRPEVLIGASISLTGGLAGFGTEEKWAVEEAVKRINGEGGIFLREYNTKLPVRLIIFDSKSDVTTFVINIERLIGVDKVDALIGETGSHLAIAIAPVLERNKAPMVGMLGTTEKIFVPPQWNYMFSNFHLARDEVLVYFDFMNNLPTDLRPKTIAIWEEASDLGADNAGWFEEYAKQFGYTVVLREKYTPGADFTALVTKTKALNPDAVGSIPAPPDAINMLKVSKELKFSPKLWAFTRGTAAGPFGATLGADSEFITASFVWHRALPFAGGLPYTRSQDLVSQFVEETKRSPTLLGIHYSSAQILFQALERAGVLDREKIRESLQTGEFDTVMGKISFGPGGKMKNTGDFIMIMQWRGGKLEIVWPKGRATAEFVYPVPAWDKR